jgi:hypothetical protein
VAIAKTTTALIVAAGLGGGCTMNAMPTEQLALTQRAIVAAREAGAAQTAPAELRLAEEKLVLGRRWIAARDYKPALWLAEQAQVDAELAALKAMSARARVAAAAQTAEFKARNARLAQGKD